MIAIITARASRCSLRHEDWSVPVTQRNRQQSLCPSSLSDGIFCNAEGLCRCCSALPAANSTHKEPEPREQTTTEMCAATASPSPTPPACPPVCLCASVPMCLCASAPPCLYPPTTRILNITCSQPPMLPAHFTILRTRRKVSVAASPVSSKMTLSIVVMIAPAWRMRATAMSRSSGRREPTASAHTQAV